LTVLKASSSDNSNTSARTEVLYGEEKTIQAIVQSFDHAMIGCDVCGNRAAPSFILGVDPIRNALVRAKKRDLRLRYIMDITNDNISYCKELVKIVELRHFDGLKGNFGLIDGKIYLAAANWQEVKPPPHLIYSNVSEVIMQQQYIFETLWYKAMPGDLKIKQIESETLGLGELVRTLYLCRDCMTPFWSKADISEHKKNAAHTRILEIPF
jgi:two-component system, OmpR family, sensor histidine kinase VicK